MFCHIITIADRMGLLMTINVIVCLIPSVCAAEVTTGIHRSTDLPEKFVNPGTCLSPTSTTRSVSCYNIMKYKKPKNVKNGSVQHEKSPRLTLSATLTLGAGAVSVVFISIFVALQSDLLPEILPETRDFKHSNDVGNNGGWRLASGSILKKYGSSKCTIARKNAKDLSSLEFEREYRYKKPLIVTFNNGAAGWTKPESWSVRSLKQEYGDWLVLSGNSLEIVRHGGNGDVESSLTQFVDKLIRSKDDLGEPLYIFDRMFYNDSSLPSTLKPPKYLEIKGGTLYTGLPHEGRITLETQLRVIFFPECGDPVYHLQLQDGRDDSIFFLGASSSGVSFHKHADAWNGVVYGEKRWFLYPPERTPPGGVYPGFTQIEWYEKIYPRLSPSQLPMECVQRAGEILYLPEGTYHGTINLGDTVAIGIQRKKASQAGEKKFYKILSNDRNLNTASTDKVKSDLQTEILQLFEELHQLFPDNTEIIMKLGEKYKNHGLLDKGLELTTRAIEIDPYFVLAHLSKADILNKQGKITEADEVYKEAVNLRANLWDVPAQYGSFLISHQRYSDAITQFKKGIELNPKQNGFWRMLKLCQEKLGDTEGAKETERLMLLQKNN